MLGRLTDQSSVITNWRKECFGLFVRVTTFLSKLKVAL